MESGRKLGYGQADAGTLHVGVAHAARANEIRPSDLAPHEVVGVVDDSHLIGFRVSDAELDVVVRRRRRGHHDGGIIGHAAKIVGRGLFVKRARRR